MIYNTIRISFYICLSALSLSTSAGENREHEDSRLKLSDEIKSILVDKKLCESEAPCSGRQLFFVSPARDGISIKTYAIKDSEILSEITKKCIETFYLKNIDITIENYHISKHEELEKMVQYRNSI